MNLPHQRIKSFVLRQGKITPGQKNAINSHLKTYGVSYQEQIINLNQVFGRTNPKIIEIGFGMGNATWQIAQTNPNNDYIGIEVHSPGVGSLLMEVEKHQLNNLKIIHHDASLVIKNMIEDNSIDGFHIFFPDPWPKKKHHKRRIIQTEFIQLLCSKLKCGGYIHLATDWSEYGTWMLDILNEIKELTNMATNLGFIERPNYRPLTKFEQRGLKLGHQVHDLLFTKNK